MLQWALQIMLQMVAATAAILGMAPGDSVPLPEILTHFGGSTVKLHVFVERVDHVPHEELPHAETSSAAGGVVPAGFHI